jgi:hypothetical protein
MIVVALGACTTSDGADGSCAGAAPQTAAPVEVSLELRGVSPAYREHFADPDALRALGAALAPCLRGGDEEGPRVWVDYDQGRGVLRLSGDWAPGCRPRHGPDGVDLAPVVPLGRALAGWRNTLAVRYDRRLARFDALIDLGVGGSSGPGPSAASCAITLAGQVPPDGSTFAPCAADGPCGDPAAGRAVIRLTPAEAGCLRPGPPERPAGGLPEEAPG